MTRKINSFLLFLFIIVVAGCGNHSVKQYAIYEVFRKEGSNKLVKLVPINHKYYCKIGDQIIIKLQHIGPDREFLSWSASATNLETLELEDAYSTLKNIPLSDNHNFTANKRGTFSITLLTFLARINIPMKTNKEWDSIQTEGKIRLLVEE